MVFRTTINYLRASNFSLQSFYYEKYQFANVEMEILKGEENSLRLYHDEYVSIREKILEVSAEWQVYIEDIETHFTELFAENSEILNYFR